MHFAWSVAQMHDHRVSGSVDRSHGDDPDVRGPIQAMIMVMERRAGPMKEFRDDCVEVFARRVPRTLPAA